MAMLDDPQRDTLPHAEPTPRRRRGWRLWRLYTIFAVQLCTVLLLFVIGNVVALGVLRVTRERARRHLPPMMTKLESRFGPTWVSALYPGWDENNLVQLYDEWTRITFDYEPFTEFNVRPMQSVYTNVSEHGFRSNGSAAPWPPDPAAFNVFVFGGSTAFGTLVPDDQTITAALQAQLRSSSCAPAAQVYNFARPGYISTQERALFEQLLLANIVPQVAVFIEGLNDSVWTGSDPQYTDRLIHLVNEINSQNDQTRWSAKARELAASLPVTLAAESFLTRFGGAGQGPAAPDAHSQGLDIEAQLNRWVANKRLRDVVAAGFGVKALTVLQPTPMYHYDLKYHAVSEGLLQWRTPQGALVRDQSQAFYERMDQRRHEPDLEGGVLWLADMQRDRAENFYVDSLHYTGAFSKEIAAAILDEMKRQGWLACSA